MRQINTPVIITLFLFTAFTISAQQQYDDESDFEFYVEEHRGDAGPDVQITGYRGTNTFVRIPPYFNDMPINRIGDEAFAGKGLTGVIIPDTVYYIGYRAFAQNKLTGLTISEGVSFIRNSAFKKTS